MSYIPNSILRSSLPEEDKKGNFEKSNHISIEGKKFSKLHVALAMHRYSDYWKLHNLRPFVNSISKVAAISLVLSVSFACGDFINLANAAYPNSNPVADDWPSDKKALNEGGVVVENSATGGGYYYNKHITGDALDNSLGWIWGTTPPSRRRLNNR